MTGGESVSQTPTNLDSKIQALDHDLRYVMETHGLVNEQFTFVREEGINAGKGEFRSNPDGGKVNSGNKAADTIISKVIDTTEQLSTTGLEDDEKNAMYINLVKLNKQRYGLNEYEKTMPPVERNRKGEVTIYSVDEYGIVSSIPVSEESLGEVVDYDIRIAQHLFQQGFLEFDPERGKYIKLKGEDTEDAQRMYDFVESKLDERNRNESKKIQETIDQFVKDHEDDPKSKKFPGDLNNRLNSLSEDNAFFQEDFVRLIDDEIKSIDVGRSMAEKIKKDGLRAIAA